MNKETKKNNTYNDALVKELMVKYGFKRDYILKSIRGDRTGEVSLRIADEYNRLNRELQILIKNRTYEL